MSEGWAQNPSSGLRILFDAKLDGGSSTGAGAEQPLAGGTSSSGSLLTVLRCSRDSGSSAGRHSGALCPRRRRDSP